MEIQCQKCHSRMNIKGTKLPTGKTASVRCPKCRGIIPITAASLKSQAKEKALKNFNTVLGETYDPSAKPFDFLDENAQTAIICEPDPKIRSVLRTTLKEMDYHTTMAEDGRDGLRKMRYHNFSLVILNEMFDTEDADTNGVLAFLQHLPMSQRRDLFIVLLSSRFRTMDNMMAFNKSVNLIVNVKNIDMLKKILRKELMAYHQFYRQFRNCAETVTLRGE